VGFLFQNIVGIWLVARKTQNHPILSAEKKEQATKYHEYEESIKTSSICARFDIDASVDSYDVRRSH
jgi:hypothetical protein